MCVCVCVSQIVPNLSNGDKSGYHLYKYVSLKSVLLCHYGID